VVPTAFAHTGIVSLHAVVKKDIMADHLTAEPNVRSIPIVPLTVHVFMADAETHVKVLVQNSTALNAV
jgi:hypothetical protein